MLTCDFIYYLYALYTYEELTQIFNEYNVPLDYMLRTCYEMNV